MRCLDDELDCPSLTCGEGPGFRELAVGAAEGDGAALAVGVGSGMRTSGFTGGGPYTATSGCSVATSTVVFDVVGSASRAVGPSAGAAAGAHAASPIPVAIATTAAVNARGAAQCGHDAASEKT